MKAVFILKASSNRPYSDGRRIARERVISHSRAHRQHMLRNKLEQRRSNQNRESRFILEKRKSLPMWWQTTAFNRMNGTLEQLHGCAPEAFALDGLNKPYQIFLFEMEQEQRLTQKQALAMECP